MIAIIDSGSTKADWVLVGNSGEQKTVHTNGINPVFHTPESVYQELVDSFPKEINTDELEKIFFYGAGCWDSRRNVKIEKGFSRYFAKAKTIVHSDLFGSARATCGNEPGIACIVGTGSNSCLYDGVDVIDNVKSMGFMVGDEGSGSFLGKMLIRAYFYREMPADIQADFEKDYPGGKTFFINKIYEEEKPNVFLASMTRFLSKHLDNIYIQKLVCRGFEEFIDRHVRKYANHNVLPIHFVGSVAYYFQEAMQIVLAERNMKAGIFIKKPIDNLVKFHLEN